MRDKVFCEFREDILSHNAKRYQIRQNSSKHDFRSLRFAIYTIKNNDSLRNIASRSYLDNDTIVSVNSITSNYDLYVGKKLLIPNMKGTIYYVENTKNLIELSKEVKVSYSILIRVNQLKRNELYQGEKIFIPFRKLSYEEKKFYSSRAFSQPLRVKGYYDNSKKGFLKPVNGRISSNYGLRLDPFTNRWTFHGGLDIAAPNGSPVYSSQDGRIIFSGWMGGYGKLIIIAHKYEYKTFYGHLSKILVKKGSVVKKGELIGRVGSTGRSTGPHLHYEIRRFNERKNPMKFTHGFKKKKLNIIMK